LPKALEAGATSIQSVNFENSNLRKSRDEARMLALKAAREKAESLAHAENGKVGKALVITERGSEVTDLGSSRYQNMSNNVSQPSSFPNEINETEAPGEIRVSSSISVTFEVTD
jgi:hypothetical protein